MGPIRLDNATAWRTYSGGKLLAKLQGKQAYDSHFPEEWICSLTSARNTDREDCPKEGLSMLYDTPEISLKELVEKDPSRYLGVRHAEIFGANTGVLLKLIDSAERLTIQVHPTREIAKKLFNSEFGKTECWHILGVRKINGEYPCVYLGFKPGITKKKWERLFYDQDITSMLNCLHKFPVKAGDTIMIKGGVPHAIGAGCFLVEIQEPTDLTIRTERVTPQGLKVSDTMCHQGVGFHRMFDTFIYTGLSKNETKQKWFLQPSVTLTSNLKITHLISYSDIPYFSLDLLEVTGNAILKNHPSFRGMYILQGDGKLDWGIDSTCIKEGQQFFIPADSGWIKLQPSSRLLKTLICYGPKII